MLIVFDEKNPHSAVIAGWGLWVTYLCFYFYYLNLRDSK